MNITDVRTAVIDGNYPWVLVRVYTDEGHVGLGEAYWGAGVEELVHRARPAVIGHDPRNIGRIYETLVRVLSGEGSIAGTTVTAISGIEIALWDLVGRIHNVPISTFFGGRFRDRIRIYADCHGGDSPDPASYARRARDVVNAGFSAIKFDLDNDNPHTRDVSDHPDFRRQWVEPFNRTIGTAERRWMVDVVRAVRDEIGPDIMLAMDCHWKYAVPDVIQLAKALEPFGLMWLEDPVPPENIDAQLRVSRSTSIPICTGENLYRKHGYRELIEKQAVSIVSPDIPKMGGLLEARKVADLADMYYMPIAPHNVASPVGTVAAAHVCASMSNFLVMEFHAHDVPWWSDLVIGEPVIANGYIELNDRPGHGLELNDDIARQHVKPGHTWFAEHP